MATLLSRSRRLGNAATLAAAAAVLFACSRGGARLEEHTAAGWKERTVVEVAVSGHRDGYRTEATFRVVRPDARPITVTLTIVVDPTAHFAGGRWEEPGLGGGKVTPLHLEFLGGQGEGASVGGHYLLEGDGGPRYRVMLPTTLLRGGWGPGG